MGRRLMEVTKISATDLRVQTRDIIERARFKSERFLVQTFGKPVAVIIGIEDFNRLLQLAQKSETESSENNRQNHTS